MRKIFEISGEELHVSFIIELKNHNTFGVSAHLLETKSLLQ